MTSLLFVLLAAAAGFWMGRRQGAGEAGGQLAALQSEVEARERRDRAAQAATLSESQTVLTRAQAACRAELDALNQRLAETRRQSEAAVAALREEQARAASVHQSLQDALVAERAAHVQTRERSGALAREAYVALRRAA
ncbi:MAG: hypothetical protein RL654_2525 [Pseudomonadota bacterium]